MLTSSPSLDLLIFMGDAGISILNLQLRKGIQTASVVDVDFIPFPQERGLGTSANIALCLQWVCFLLQQHPNVFNEHKEKQSNGQVSICLSQSTWFVLVSWNLNSTGLELNFLLKECCKDPSYGCLSLALVICLNIS